MSFAPAAVQDLEDIGDYIYAENPQAAFRFVTALRVRCNRLADAPRGGAPRSELWAGLRSVPFRRYVVFYTVTGDDVRVERILHGSRDVVAVFSEDEEPPQN
ncbi:type II toxin-antitoxin system RelE/ParE family toxin [Rhizobium sp. BT03]|uniref:type II toxin-antitoxin system RelE/ParE family toxin n=1 Tax=Rhizobium sp. BT03 TaxID=3045156 RepID=UPI0024B3D661|nr:type II toxin-antitoxin system RelE/ParE family toxin [Rhizobium sp. BT03]WHO71964.1 type II toxin-antitoxin system RelE/ParE family toxin [Rhizobium sp. BT03]